MFNSPVAIQTMLFCYYLAYPKQHFLDAAPAQREALARFKDAGLIDADLRATEKGRAWVAMICNTPLPIEKTGFCDPRDNSLVTF